MVDILLPTLPALLSVQHNVHTYSTAQTQVLKALAEETLLTVNRHRSTQPVDNKEGDHEAQEHRSHFEPPGMTLVLHSSDASFTEGDAVLCNLVFAV